MTFILTDVENEQIISKIIEVMISPTIPIQNKRTIAEVIESAFHFLAISIAKQRKGEEEEEGKEQYSISQAFAENILQVLTNSRENKNSAIGAILVLQSYLSALTHDKRLMELGRLFLSHLISMNNEIMAEILKSLNLMSEDEFHPDNEKVLAIIE